MSKDGIFLRELERGDLSTINAWRADRSLVSLLGGNFRHVGREIDDKWFDAYLGSRANNVRLAVCMASSGALIGVTYLLGIDWLNRSAEFSIQIGAESARGRGMGEAAARSILAHAFTDLNLHRVSLDVLEGNARAIALYEKLGFRTEGLHRQAVFKDGQYLNVVSMALLSTDFAEPSSAPVGD
ncbi:GNAT family N-acetyltransferase [Caballeronia cordobensis]|uniref:GCN5 family acetyltransferase n=1 Tax=Caballeronia cordobensis TaxID=1353886 RepID=A0A158EZE4_CABCO|nr:GNAT family protein [Caballeronia cordobensis]AQG97490.1 UDP-4-amino-4,6-dideoxy-N-acetyl-beta-L-altrosamine N-acetyltransferase [Burkholderia sp. KK1]BAO85160.1 acetyltransferase [Burkholderia sp. RPE67]BBP94987.1 N-acetyltransferase [Burkholderia sp. SFA1]SAL12924.1 GCN5 family acetyltransferase [Caballeronia cordobensis]